MNDAVGVCPADSLKLQFAESRVPEALSEMISSLQGGSNPHDLCSIKIASNLIVSLLLGGESCSTQVTPASCHNIILYSDHPCSDLMRAVFQTSPCRSALLRVLVWCTRTCCLGCRAPTCSCSCLERSPSPTLPGTVRHSSLHISLI